MTPDSTKPGAADPGLVEYSDQLGGGTHGHDTPAREAVFVDELRRRRAASWRCPPLACGRRDPLDPEPALPLRRQRPAPELVASWAAAGAVGGWWAVLAVAPAEVVDELRAAAG